MFPNFADLGISGEVFADGSRLVVPKDFEPASLDVGPIVVASQSFNQVGPADLAVLPGCQHDRYGLGLRLFGLGRAIIFPRPLDVDIEALAVGHLDGD